MTREEFARQLMREVKAGSVRFYVPTLKRRRWWRLRRLARQLGWRDEGKTFYGPGLR